MCIVELFHKEITYLLYSLLSSIKDKTPLRNGQDVNVHIFASAFESLQLGSFY